MRTFDLNADLGEGGLHDAKLTRLASSVNIACGGHAGDADTMREAVRRALAAGTMIGAHPGYDDRAHFGRRELSLPPQAVTDLVARQVAALARICAAEGASLHHVKPHGALYNQANRDPALARAFADGVAMVAPKMLVYVPPTGELITAAALAGLSARGEGFADRRYLDAATLVPRGDPGAVIEDPAEAAAQALEIALRARVMTIGGAWQALDARTLCVHGDGPSALAMLASVRQALERSGVCVAA